MDFAEPISNNLRKLVSSLQRKKEREENNLFVAEGEKLCEELLLSSYNTEFIVVRSGAGDQAIRLAEKYDRAGISVYIARKQQFDQLCDTKSPQDIIAVVKISNDSSSKGRSFIALEDIADPGNLGTIIRTADWFGFKDIVLGGDCVDRFNSKTVRATMGSLFRCNFTIVEDLAEYLNNLNGFEIYGAVLNADKDIQKCAPGSKFGIVFGSESKGLSSKVIKTLTHKFIIPGIGGAESLNVAVSVGISCYHFSRFL